MFVRVGNKLVNLENKDIELRENLYEEGFNVGAFGDNRAYIICRGTLEECEVVLNHLEERLDVAMKVEPKD